MKLADLIKSLEIIDVFGNIDCEIKDIKIDSNCVTKDSLFICLKGGDKDGHDYSYQAQSYGASAIVCERKLDVSIPQIIVKDCREAVSLLASAFYDFPSKKLCVIGVVGTNGKTTTAKLVYDILNFSGRNCGLVGTLGTYYKGVELEQNLTTPDPLDLHRIFADMVKKGVKYVVMEVSAHAIYYKKTCGINFFGAIFTNFSQDHLDFFKNMDSYEKVKLDFFKNNNFNFVVTNADDKTGRKISEIVPKAITYGIDNPADVFAIDVTPNKMGTKFIINLFDCIYDIRLNLLGKFNVSNALASATACALMGVPVGKVKNALFQADSIPGRLETAYDKDYSVIIDYAHTPDGLEKVLKVLKPLVKNRLICLFGCGGNRDKEKRKIMGEISGKYADFTIVTSDNPRFEDPFDIMCEIEKGVLMTSSNYILIQEREEAIKYAVNLAKKGDIILLAGKGAERYTETLGIKRLYNDKDTLKNILEHKNA